MPVNQYLKIRQSTSAVKSKPMNKLPVLRTVAQNGMLAIPPLKLAVIQLLIPFSDPVLVISTSIAKTHAVPRIILLIFAVVVRISVPPCMLKRS